MADKTLTIRGNVLHVTTSHIEESMAGTLDRAPYHYHSIRPSGQYPASDDLCERFRHALKRLEGLLYAVFGAVPDYTNGKQWWKSPRLRCLWPEQEFVHDSGSCLLTTYKSWFPQVGQIGQIGYSTLGGTTSAGSTGYVDWSRSDALNRQYRRTNHDADWFPVGSVSRSATGGNYDDPVIDQDVTITWAVPTKVRSMVAAVELVYRVGGTTHTVSMGTADGGASWAYTIPGQPNNTEVLFYLHVVTNEDVPRHIYDPYGTVFGDAPTLAGIPADDPKEGPGNGHNLQQFGSCYYYYVLTHYAPYANGLPELIHEEYTGDKAKSLKRCTGTWVISPMGNIKPGLINLARYCLDRLGSQFEHNPEKRGASPGCCLQMPIRWRWSGANRPWLYKPGGKDTATTPITNLWGDQLSGDATARRTWRGVPSSANLYGGSTPLHCGHDESWLSYPEYVRYQFYGDPNHEWYPGFGFGYGARRGLREGDQIDPIHLEEIIAAVDYLIDNGLWYIQRCKSCKRTPTSCAPAGVSYPTTLVKNWDADGNVAISWPGEGDVCNIGGALPGGCWAVDPVCEIDPDPNLTYYQKAIGWKRVVTPPQPWERPTSITACRNATGTKVAAGMCENTIYVNTTCGNSENDDGFAGQKMHSDVQCGTYRFVPGHDLTSCFADAECAVDPHGECSWEDGYAARSTGYWFYLCGPSRYYNGPTQEWYTNGQRKWTVFDELHGNGWSKMRPYGDWNNGCWAKGPQYMKSMGNRGDKAYTCSDASPSFVTSVGFDQVVDVGWNGPTTKWIENRLEYCPSCGANQLSDLIRPLPGLDYMSPPDINGARVPLCTFQEEHIYQECQSGYRGTIHYAAARCDWRGVSYPNCPGGGGTNVPVYVRIDLNKNGSGVPQLYDYELAAHLLDENGVAVSPTVHPDTIYETKTSDTVLTVGGVQCPFDTWVNSGDYLD